MSKKKPTTLFEQFGGTGTTILPEGTATAFSPDKDVVLSFDGTKSEWETTTSWSGHEGLLMTPEAPTRLTPRQKRDDTADWFMDELRKL
jgi:hypothetical protein